MFGTSIVRLRRTRARQFLRSAALTVGLLSVGLILGGGHAFAGATTGTWTKLANDYPLGGSGLMMLLTDGTVMVQGSEGSGGVSKSWRKLTPDSSGNYINGTWSSMASMSTERLYVGSNVMPNGKVFLLGGEYSGAAGAQNITNTGEIYDPVANTWNPITFPLPQFGDDPTILLPNGKILCGYIFDGRCYLFNPATNTFSATGTKRRNDASDEETWVLLPDGSVLSYDAISSPDTGPGTAQRYDSTTGTWSDTGAVPVPLSGSSVGSELGPATVLPNGNVLQVGATSFTAIYSPSGNSWVQGPNLPNNMGADDAPGVMMPDGHFIFLVDTIIPNIFSPPTKMLDYDYKTNTITDITPILPTALQTEFMSTSAFYRRFLMLPNGHVLFNTGTGSIWDYAPSGAPLATWKPTISGITKGSGGNPVYTLTGTQLTGLWQGASYGDDAEMDSNYPIITLTGPSPSKVVHFAKTTNWTPGICSPGNATKTTVQFSLPAGLANGTYTLVTSANGIKSDNYTFTLPFTNAAPSNIVDAAYDKSTNTLTLTGDTGDNSILVTLQGTHLTVQGAGTTLVRTLGNSAQSQLFTVTSGLTIVGTFTTGGKDSVSFMSVSANSANLTFGPGNDSVNLTYCDIGTFTMDGGAGTDSLVQLSTKIGTKTLTSVP